MKIYSVMGSRIIGAGILLIFAISAFVVFAWEAEIPISAGWPPQFKRTISRFETIKVYEKDARRPIFSYRSGGEYGIVKIESFPPGKISVTFKKMDQ